MQQEDLLYVIENDDSDTGLQPLSNSVLYLLQNPFERRTLVYKIKIKELGPDQPDIKMLNEYNQASHDRQRQYRYATGRRSPDCGEKTQ